MPDATIDTPEREVRDVPRDRPPVNNELPYHPFQQSEFPEGRGRCDSCGGGPDAPIHQKPVDAAEQLKRIADALEDIAGVGRALRAFVEREQTEYGKTLEQVKRDYSSTDISDVEPK